MPLYEYFCDKCQKEVSLTLSMSEREKGGAKCPQCGARPDEEDAFCGKCGAPLRASP